MWRRTGYGALLCTVLACTPAPDGNVDPSSTSTGDDGSMTGSDAGTTGGSTGLSGSTASSTGAVDDTTTGDPGMLVPRVEEEVSFEGDGLVLEGTMIVPEHYSNEQLTGIVLVHGSGPQSRDVVLPYSFPMATGQVSAFVDLAEGLADAGFAVLRYDKRTCFSGNGCDNDYPTPNSDLTVLDFAQDADAALDYVAARPEVDPERLVFVGHSQGAQFVPMFLDGRDDLVAGVMLAGPYRPVEELLAWQAQLQRMLLEEAGLTPEQIDMTLASLDLMVQQLQELRAGTFMGTTIGGASVAFWQSWMQVGDDAPGLAMTVDRPMLALSGDYDFNVPPEDTMAWIALFDGVNPNPGHEGEVLPCLTHALNCVSDPDWMDVTPDEVEDVVSEELTSRVAEFLEEV